LPHTVFNNIKYPGVVDQTGKIDNNAIMFGYRYLFPMLAMLSLGYVFRLFNFSIYDYAFMARLVRQIINSVTNVASGSLNLLFPPRCVCCYADYFDTQDHQTVCPKCIRRLVPEKWTGCRHCGATIPDELPESDNCAHCRTPDRLFDTVIPLGGYQGDLRNVILRMKHPQHNRLTKAIGCLLAEKRFAELSNLHVDMIIPIPMYWTRRWRRGINNPEHVANCLSQKLCVPIRKRLLERCKNTVLQTKLSPKERFSNIRGAFRVRSGESLKGLRILLVDDVLTTGATSSEAAKILKKAGAQLVAVAVIARAQGER
jgi:ComF family protein